MKRRQVLKSAIAGATALAAPRIVRAEGAKTVTFVPHADLASIDPVWTTADITRNYSLAVFDTLYGYDAQFNVQPQMVEGHRMESDGKVWELTLRDGLAFHDGAKVLARDCVATIKRFGTRDPFGQALMKQVDELSAPSDKVIRFRLKKPFPLLQNALAQVYCAIMPERLATTDPMKQIPEAIGSGPFKFVASERIPGSRVVFAKNDAYVPRKDGVSSFNAGPKIVHVDRVVWNFIPDPATASAALQQREVDWWQNPTIDLVPQLKRDKDLTIVVKDRTGEIGCLRFNQLFPPFDNAAIRRVVVEAMDQKEIMEAVAGAVPSLIKTDVGIFVPGSPMANDYAPLMQRLHAIDAAGYHLGALEWQDELWDAYSHHRYGFALGISAFPSMHNAISFLYVLAAWKAPPWVRAVAWAFASTILIGSVHLGWHYVADGLVAWPAMAAIWWGAGLYLRKCGYDQAVQDADYEPSWPVPVVPAEEEEPELIAA